MNDNTPRTRGSIALGPSGNRQGSLKRFDLETGKVVCRRIIKQIQWPDGTIEMANAWGQKSKHIARKESITFLNRHHEPFNWENDDMSDLVVTNDQPKMIHPTIAAELPGIEVERETLSRVQIFNRIDVTYRLSVAGVNAGLDAEVETNTETRGVDDADADQGVAPDGEDDEPPELLIRYDDDSSDDEDSDYESESDGDDDSEGDE